MIVGSSLALFCTWCSGQIPSERLVRNWTAFCSPECHREYRKAKRKAGRLKSCNSCGRLLSTRERRRLQEEAMRSAQTVSEVVA